MGQTWYKKIRSLIFNYYWEKLDDKLHTGISVFRWIMKLSITRQKYNSQLNFDPEWGGNIPWNNDVKTKKSAVSV
jgi:hypothetical protein